MGDPSRRGGIALSNQEDTLDESKLRELADRGAAELVDATAIELLRWTDENFGGDGACGYVVASNMADAVLIDMAAKVRPGVPVLFLDTGYHFAETIGTRDATMASYDIDMVNVEPEQTVAEQDAAYGKDLFASDPATCCRLRKVEPLARTLRNYSAWVTGLRRVEAPTRANAPLISYDEQFHLVKINPIAAWSDQDMADYIAEHHVLVNPLVDEGYPSIGCAPCTAKPAPGSDPRSGRWQGSNKTECGLHSS
ncbi:phosphoadenylyl-sulfate reductase [Mycobacterium sp. SVM_VP21]|nr:phosphoadenylyl-sulfate reductase [Mycobacterium sp. SVM_VP21]